MNNSERSFCKNNAYLSNGLSFPLIIKCFLPCCAEGGMNNRKDFMAPLSVKRMLPPAVRILKCWGLQTSRGKAAAILYARSPSKTHRLVSLGWVEIARYMNSGILLLVYLGLGVQCLANCSWVHPHLRELSLWIFGPLNLWWLFQFIWAHRILQFYFYFFLSNTYGKGLDEGSMPLLIWMSFTGKENAFKHLRGIAIIKKINNHY